MTATQLPAQQIYSVQWAGDIRGCLQLIDQTLLPLQLKVLSLSTIEEAFEAIVTLRVRGAPAIGIAAAYGVVLGFQKALHGSSVSESREIAFQACDYLATSRPTAVNLFWALDRMRAVVERNKNPAPGDAAGTMLGRTA